MTTSCQDYGDVRGKISLKHAQENLYLLEGVYQQRVGHNEWPLSGHLLDFRKVKYLN